MLQDDSTLADEVTLMARDHFNKLAALAVRVQGARELGVLAAHSAVGERLLPEELSVEKMASAWAKKSAALSAPLKGVPIGAPFQKEAAYAELGDEYMEKLAIGWMGRVPGGLKKAVEFFSKGKAPKLPRVGSTPSTSGTARKFDAPGSRNPYRTPWAPPPPPAPAVTRSTTSQAADLTSSPTKKRPWYRPSLKTQLALGGTMVGATYLGGKGLDLGTAFLTPQPPGTAYQYGGAAPSHFMRPQMGM